MTAYRIPWDPNSSQLITILPHVISSVENIAPEKRSALKSIIDRVRFIVDDEPGFVFRARGVSDPRQVRCSIVGLEFLWCIAYGHVSIYQTAKQTGAVEMSFSDTAETERAAKMLTFAFTDRAGPEHPRWAYPREFPIPEAADLTDLTAVGTVHMACELFLCAAAWILHHELGHVGLGHLDEVMKSSRDESEADDAATTWILDGPTDSNVILKRGLGVAIAVISLGALALFRRRGAVAGTAYPPAGHRIMHALGHSAFGDHHQVHDFACVALKVHLDHRGIAVGKNDFNDPYECLHRYCRTLTDHELNR